MKNLFDQLGYDDYFVRRDPSPSANFEEGYWGAVSDPDGKVRDMSERTERSHKRELAATELAFINALSPGRILDLGCGTGAMLEGVLNSWEKKGVEISKFAAVDAKKYGDIFIGELQDASYPDEHFDVILMFHVIEHVKDPVALILEIRRVLKTGGWFIVATPDFDSGCARRFGAKFRLLNDITHISLFSSNSLQRLLENYGFGVKATDYPFFDTKYFTEENLLRLFDTQGISPPFYGNIMTKYSVKLSHFDALERLRVIKEALGVCRT